MQFHFFHLRECSDGVERRDFIGKRAPAHPAPGGTLRPCSAPSGTRLQLLSFFLVFPAGRPEGSVLETPAHLPMDLLLRHSAEESALRRQSRVRNAAAARPRRIRWVHPAAPRPMNGVWHLPFRPAVPLADNNAPAPPSSARAGCWPQSLFCTLLPRRYYPAFPVRARKCNWPARDHARQHSRLAVWLCFYRHPEIPELPGRTRSGQSVPSDCLYRGPPLAQIQFSLCAPVQKPEKDW